MYQLEAGQIKAARAMLGWSQEEMAQASGLAVTTIRNIETGNVPRGRTAEMLRKAVENAGLEFTNSQGVQRRKDIDLFHGAESVGLLFEDIYRTIKANDGGELIAMLKSQQVLSQLCDQAGKLGTKNLQSFPTKCLLFENKQSKIGLPLCQFRWLPPNSTAPAIYFVYGNKFVFVDPEYKCGFRFVVMNSFSLVSSWRFHFLNLWNTAQPLAS
jgi:transcriptional regulator with XRE-family HTH domain